jgi:hypothetical protein
MLKEAMSFVGDDVLFIPFSATTGEGNDVLRDLLERVNVGG